MALWSISYAAKMFVAKMPTAKYRTQLGTPFLHISAPLSHHSGLRTNVMSSEKPSLENRPSCSLFQCSLLHCPYQSDFMSPTTSLLFFCPHPRTCLLIFRERGREGEERNIAVRKKH